MVRREEAAKRWATGITIDANYEYDEASGVLTITGIVKVTPSTAQNNALSKPVKLPAKAVNGHFAP